MEDHVQGDHLHNYHRVKFDAVFIHEGKLQWFSCIYGHSKQLCCYFIAMAFIIVELKFIKKVSNYGVCNYQLWIDIIIRMQFPANPGIETDFHTPKIVNVVGTFTLDIREDLKLADIASRWNNSRYNKVRFSGLVTRNTDPKATFMIFSNGKVNVAGAKSEDQCLLSCTKLIKKMSKLGVLRSIKPKVNFKVQNVVATVSTKSPINLELMSSKCSRNCTFVPESFPGLIYKMNDPKATFLVFSTGKVVMVGLQNEQKVSICFRNFYKTLKKFKINPNRYNS